MKRTKHQITPMQIQTALNENGSQKEAAKALNVPPTTLSEIMKRHGFKQVKRWECQ